VEESFFEEENILERDVFLEEEYILEMDEHRLEEL
jgi:hypothetical protein